MSMNVTFVCVSVASRMHTRLAATTRACAGVYIGSLDSMVLRPTLALTSTLSIYVTSGSRIATLALAAVPRAGRRPPCHIYTYITTYTLAILAVAPDELTEIQGPPRTKKSTSSLCATHLHARCGFTTTRSSNSARRSNMTSPSNVEVRVFVCFKNGEEPLSSSFDPRRIRGGASGRSSDWSVSKRSTL